MSLVERHSEYLEKKYAFRPIPHEYPFHPQIPAIIDSVRGDQPIFVLCKNRQEVVVEGPFIADLLPKHDPTDEFFKYRWVVATLQYSSHILEIIQEHLNQIDFNSEHKRVFLIKNSKTGRYSISQPKPLGLVQIDCPLWATIIPVEDITFTVFCPLSERRGIWKGLEVDVMYAWNRQDQRFMNNAMKGYRCVQRLNLTFEVYGHAVDKDGYVVGLVSEAAWGRMIRSSDRALIYSTLAQLQAAGCLYKAVSENRFLICNGKVRLLDLHLISWFGNDRKKLDSLAEVFHWEAANTLFHDLGTYGPYGYQEYLCPLPRFYMGQETVDHLPPLPTLNTSLLLWPHFFDTSFVSGWTRYEYTPDAPQEDDEPISGTALQHGRRIVGPVRTRQSRRHRDEIPGEAYRLRASREQGPSAIVRSHHPYGASATDHGRSSFIQAVRRGGAEKPSDETISSITLVEDE